MKYFIVLTVAALASADISHVLNNEGQAETLKADFDISPEGSYTYSFQTQNGISAQEEGALMNTNSQEPPFVAVRGISKYTSPEGTRIILQYVADENGFQPQGEHLPTPPPVPEAILRSLAYIASHPAKPEEVAYNAGAAAYNTANKGFF